tara:strand:- start:195 stop:485 length:291 start_codon:yes stop_codon:yes gene_type:complete
MRLKNKDYEALIQLYKLPLEKALARRLFQLDQDQLRELLLSEVDFDDLLEWHKTDDERVSDTVIEELLSEDKEWVVEEIMKNTINGELSRKLNLSS